VILQPYGIFALLWKGHELLYVILSIWMKGPEKESKATITCFLDCTLVAPCLVVGHLLDKRKNIITSSPNEPKCVLNIQQMTKGKAQNLVSTSLISCPCNFFHASISGHYN
jgi:hypothetical protein